MRKRSVCVESTMSIDEINKKFEFLDNRFDRINERDKAEFIIFDLDHPVPELEKELVDEIEPYFFTCKPIILAALEEGEEQHNFGYIKKYYCEPPVCKKKNQLIDALEWFSFIFIGITKDAQKGLIHLTLQKSRET